MGQNQGGCVYCQVSVIYQVDVDKAVGIGAIVCAVRRCRDGVLQFEQVAEQGFRRCGAFKFDAEVEEFVRR